ncbi:hypothetical protein C4B63_17g76 [Trypanosoma cruzi]|uniref:Uncharacterized protein n=1 Tax=Trypanosoma cruzi TaxID=5693 RepID=A0A2V2VKJ8_TRYCR|nr:hypothetical protein C4B63_17g76 [Trypanosoma cruzi]
MLFAWILTIIALFVSWLWNVRLRSSNSHRPYKVLHKPIQDLQADFVVVGAGPGGLAASKCLIEHEKECLVIVIERGMDPSPAGPFPRITGLAHRHNLLSYAVESVGSKLDSGWYVEYPLRYGRMRAMMTSPALLHRIREDVLWEVLPTWIGPCISHRSLQKSD